MTRKHDWQLCLEAFVRERKSLPFAWGTNDCAIFAADCVRAMTGTDVALPALRKHTTELQAARSLKRHGGLVGIATAAMGEPLPPLMAGIGDVVLSKAGERDMLAICNGGTCMAPGPDGLVQLAMATATLCWRVA
ncbi:MAG: hypothetical protein JJD98_00100 [Polaromonas sp.]|nr:hypothetical protein [Polaromonas sp.]